MQDREGAGLNTQKRTHRKSPHLLTSCSSMTFTGGFTAPRSQWPLAITKSVVREFPSNSLPQQRLIIRTTSTPAFQNVFYKDFEVGLTFLGALGDDAVDFVRVWDVQLASLHEFLKVVALVEGAAEASLPGRRVRLVDPLPKLAFKQRPGLQTGHR